MISGRLRARQNRAEEALRNWQDAVAQFEKTLTIDSENVAAHHNLQLLYAELGQPEKADEHGRLHARYKADDNAQGRAVRLARQKYPAANHAAEAVVRYPLQREQAPGLPVTAWRVKPAAVPQNETLAAQNPVGDAKAGDARAGALKAGGAATESVGDDQSLTDNLKTTTTSVGVQ